MTVDMVETSFLGQLWDLRRGEALVLNCAAVTQSVGKNRRKKVL